MSAEFQWVANWGYYTRIPILRDCKFHNGAKVKEVCNRVVTYQLARNSGVNSCILLQDWRCVSAIVFSRVPTLSWLIVQTLLQTSLTKVLFSFFMHSAISRLDLWRFKVYIDFVKIKLRKNIDSTLKDVWLHDGALWLVPVLVVDRISMMFQSFMTTVTLWMTDNDVPFFIKKTGPFKKRHDIFHQVNIFYISL